MYFRSYNFLFVLYYPPIYLSLFKFGYNDIVSAENVNSNVAINPSRSFLTATLDLEKGINCLTVECIRNKQV